MQEVFGKYRLVRRIARGGMAEVFLAAHEGLEGFRKHLAIKRILPAMSSDADFVTMFLDEARLVARFNHPNIVQIFELGEVDGRYFLAMEYVHGVSLVRILRSCQKEGKALPPEYGARIVSQACEGLEYAHNFTDAGGIALNLIHRDISPQNLMLGYNGVVKVLDFGIAKAAGRIYQTQASVLKGKVAYMSPEQIAGRSDLDRRSDIFSLGVVLWETCTGQRLFRGAHVAEIMASIVNDPVPDPRGRNPQVSSELRDVILRSLHKDRTRRYASARQMQADLEEKVLSRGPVSSYDLSEFLRALVPPGDPEAGDSVPTPAAPPAGPAESDSEAGSRTVTQSLDPAEPPTQALSPRPSEPEAPGPPLETDRTPASTGLQQQTEILPAGQLSSPVRPAEDDGLTQLMPAEQPDDRPLVIGSDAAVALGPRDTLPDGSPLDSPEPPSRGMALPAAGLVLIAVLGIGLIFWDDWAPLLSEPAPVPPAPAALVDAGPASSADGARPDDESGAVADLGPDDGSGGGREAADGGAGPDAGSLTGRTPDRGADQRLRAAASRGWLRIDSTPATRVTIDGRGHGRTPLGPVALKAGLHRLVLSDPSRGIRIGRSVRIRAGHTERLSVTIGKGALRVFVLPFGVVSVDGKRIGLTPLSAPIELYEGQHTVEAVCERTGKRKSRRLAIEAGKTATLNLDLR
ncbi:MAG: protein kinase [Deltaproteobacteria bacterium]|nr:protein kinase [Deltaproteobacteria bacterium]